MEVSLLTPRLAAAYSLTARRIHDARHVSVLRSLDRRLVTTRPCLAEAFHLLRNFMGRPGQAILLDWLEIGFLDVHESSEQENKRVYSLMRQYSDAPMDYADASLVAAAKSIGVAQILAVDSRFYAYRLFGKTPFAVLP